MTTAETAIPAPKMIQARRCMSPGRSDASDRFACSVLSGLAVSPSSLFEPVEPRRVRGGFVFFGSWLVVTGIALALTPNPAGHGTHKQLGLSACPSAVLFDRPCPGCGLTTSWTAFVHGDFAASVSAHLFGP